MIKRIIFFNYYPFNLRDYKRFGMELLQQNGFKVEVWDISSILIPNPHHDYGHIDDFNYQGHRIFTDKVNLISALATLKNDDFIVMTILYNLEVLWLYREVSRIAAKYASFIANAWPWPNFGKKQFSVFFYFEKLRNFFSDTKQKILKNIFGKIPFWLLGVKPTALLLAGGEITPLRWKQPSDRNTETLWIHASDYDLYLQEKKSDIDKSDTVVFLDEYFPFHPDFAYSGMKSPISAEKYYPLLNKVFDNIEKELGVKVIIAAHPRSQYEKHLDYFQGRQCIRDNTPSLIRDSRFVLAHYGAGLSFANLFNKPVLFLTYWEFEICIHGSFIKESAKWFGKKPISIDKDYNINWEYELNIDKDQYSKYKQVYIKTKQSQDLPFWQIVANRVKKGF